MSRRAVFSSILCSSWTNLARKAWIFKISKETHIWYGDRPRVSCGRSPIEGAWYDQFAEKSWFRLNTGLESTLMCILRFSWPSFFSRFGALWGSDLRAYFTGQTSFYQYGKELQIRTIDRKMTNKGFSKSSSLKNKREFSNVHSKL